jgi:protein-S-isoprenylcysteine O-methyltransferase Ste14
MILDKFSDRLVKAAGVARSPGYKLVAGILGALTFLCIVPALLFFAGVAVEKHILAGSWAYVVKVFSWVCVVGGLLCAAWSVVSLVFAGGTPIPVAPPQRLVVKGPYRFSRNPMLFGIMFYYLGLGLIYGSVGVGVAMLLLVLIVGSLYNKLVEERELLARFGKEYEEYRSRTPFLLPKF